MDSSQILPEGYKLTHKQLKAMKRSILKLARSLEMEVPKNITFDKVTILDDEMVAFIDDLFYKILLTDTVTYGSLTGVNGLTDGHYSAEIRIDGKVFKGSIRNGKDYSYSSQRIVKAIAIEKFAKFHLN